MNNQTKNISVNGGGKPFLNRTDSLFKYLKDINKFGLIGHDETTDLLREYATAEGKRKEQIRDKVFKLNARIVVSLAKKYCSTEDNLMDLIEEGNIGLLNAIDKFDPEKGATFISFALFYIRREINNFKSDMTPIVRRTNRSKTQFSINGIISRLTQRFERQPTDDEVMEEYNRTNENKQIIEKEDIVSVEYVYIDNQQTDTQRDSNTCTEYDMSTSSLNSYLKEMDSDHRSELLSHLMKGLNATQRKVLIKHLGLKGTISQGFYSIATELGFSYERVRQLYSEAMTKLIKAAKNIQHRHVSDY